MALMGTGPVRGQADAYVREVAAAIARNDVMRAAQIADNGIRQGAQHPALFNARALGLQAQGRLPQALQDFERALALTPGNPVMLNAIGMCLVRMNRSAEGIAAFDAALEAEPDNPLTHYRKGWALAGLGNNDAATRCYEQAVALDPAQADALAGLASLAARRGDAQGARGFADRALAVNPKQATALVSLAMVDNAAGNFAAAETRLKALLANAGLDAHTRGVALGFLADALDGQDRVAEAFEAYAAKNAELHRLHAPRFAGMRRARDFIDDIAGYMDTAPAEPWASRTAPSALPDGPKTHVFLLGFIRSGTTLLEQVLGTHPDVVRLEERETFPELAREFLTVPDGLNRLAALEGAALEAARAQYWTAVRGFGTEPAGKVFIDKQPLNTFNLPLIARLFPDAKILFALRDPRDVVFSAFRRHFAVNATMFEMLRLEDAGRFYSSVMRLAEICRAKLPLDLHEHRYEAMVEDFEGTVRASCAFLGLEWTEAMRNFSQSARTSEIRSPSAGQVRRGLYGEGVGQWRKYGAELGPLLPILAPWVAKFGYPAA